MALTVKQARSQLSALTPFVLKNEPQFLTFMSGFFVFPVAKQHSCLSPLGPAVPLAPHNSTLFIRNALLDRMSGPTIGVREEDGIAIIDVAGRFVSFPDCDRSAARTINGTFSTTKRAAHPAGLDFRLIPDFGSLCCGASLDLKLATPKTLQTRLDLVGGRIGAFGDAHTCKETWTWRNCRGQAKTQRLSSLAAHISDPLPALKVAITPLDLSRDPTVIPVAAIPGLNLGVIGLTHVPPDGSADKDSMTIDIAHLEATLAMCRKKGSVSVQFGERRKKKCAVKGADDPFEELDALLRKILDVSIRNNGRPNCGARQMAV